MDMRKVVGRNVLRLRGEKGLSQEELSFRSGFGRAYLSGLETGKRNPTIVTLWEIATALGATPIDLLQPVPDPEEDLSESSRPRKRPAERQKEPVTRKARFAKSK